MAKVDKVIEEPERGPCIIFSSVQNISIISVLIGKIYYEFSQAGYKLNYLINRSKESFSFL